MYILHSGNYHLEFQRSLDPGYVPLCPFGLTTHFTIGEFRLNTSFPPLPKSVDHISLGYCTRVQIIEVILFVFRTFSKIEDLNDIRKVKRGYDFQKI